MRVWLAILALLTLRLVAAESPKVELARQEQERLTKPRVGVVLATFHRSSLRPAMPVVTPDLQTLFFSREFHTGSCYGRGLWAWTLAPSPGEHTDNPRSLADINCVLDLRADGEGAVIRYRDDNNKIQVKRVTPTGELTSIFDSRTPGFPTGQWRWKQDLLRGVPGGGFQLQEDAWRAVFFKNQTVHGVVPADGGIPGTRFLRLSLKEQDSEQPPLLWELETLAKDYKEKLPEGVEWRSFDLTSYGWMLASYRPSEQGSSAMSGFFLIDLEVGKIKGWYGAPDALVGPANWDQTTLRRWAARALDYTALSPHGILLVDQTSQVGSEFRNVTYFSPWRNQTEAPFVRVKGLPYDSITGVSVVQDGLLVAFGEDQTIAWFGAKNPFPEKWYRSRRPNLREMSASAYRKLIGEIK